MLVKWLKERQGLGLGIRKNLKINILSPALFRSLELAEKILTLLKSDCESSAQSDFGKCHESRNLSIHGKMDNEALRPLRALREIESFHSPILGCVNTESPLAEKIRGMIGWSKQAFDLDPRVYGMGK
jgi:hypothetical protein